MASFILLKSKSLFIYFISSVKLQLLPAWLPLPQNR
jgi:hypothetical protein